MMCHCRSKLDLGSLTGVFADEHGIYVEREHGQK